jgi:hypothetical protein
LAKQTAPVVAPKKPTNAIPKETDPRAELFWLLGSLKGMNIDSADRIGELVIFLTTPAQALDRGEEE